MRPQFRDFICGSAARMAWKAADRLIAITASHLSAGNLDRRGVLDAGVVHQDVHAPCLRNHRGHLGRLRHVGRAVAYVDFVFGLQVGEERVDRSPVAEAVQHDVGAARGERTRDAEADAARRAGDERRFPLSAITSSSAPGPHRRGRHQAGRRMPVKPVHTASVRDSGCHGHEIPVTDGEAGKRKRQ